MAALFGAGKRKPMLGGMQMPGPISGFGGGTFNTDGTMATPVQRDTIGETLGTTTEADRKPSFFGQGGVGRSIAGFLGDYLLQRSGGSPIYSPMMAMQQQQAAQLAAEQRKRSLDMADWTAKEQWKLDHPAPVNNDTVNDFNWYKGLSPEDRALYEQMRPEYRQGPDGQYYRVQKAIPAPAGVTFTPLGNGGPTPPASGTFR